MKLFQAGETAFLCSCSILMRSLSCCCSALFGCCGTRGRERVSRSRERGRFPNSVRSTRLSLKRNSTNTPLIIRHVPLLLRSRQITSIRKETIFFFNLPSRSRQKALTIIESPSTRIQRIVSQTSSTLELKLKQSSILFPRVLQNKPILCLNSISPSKLLSYPIHS